MHTVFMETFMGFAINPSLNFIDVPAQHIHELYRSTSGIVLADARFRGHPCDAYICIRMIEKEMNAYVAIHNNAFNSVLIYTSDLVASTPGEYPKVLKEAEEFTTSMGFSMEKVNLEFSAAMKEVIVKGFRVMRPPPPQKKPIAKPHKPETPKASPPEPKTIVLPDIAGTDEPLQNALTEVQSLRAELASVRSALEKLTREKISLEQNALNKISALKATCEQAVESKRQSDERLAEEVRKREELEKSGKNSVDSSQVKSLQEQLAKSAEAAATVEKQLRNEAKSLAEKLASLQQEKVTLQESLAAEQLASSAAAQHLASLKAAEKSRDEALKREEELLASFKIIEKELNESRLELESLRGSGNREGELLQRIAETEAELAEARTALESQLSSIEPEEPGQEPGKLEAIEAEYVRLATASMEKEAELTANLAQAMAENERLASELELQSQVAAMEQAALRAELRRLIVGGVTITAPPETAVPQAPPAGAAAQPAYYQPAPQPAPVATVAAQVQPPPPPVEAAPEEEDDGTPDSPINADTAILAGFSADFGGLFGGAGSSTTEFAIDPSVAFIEYNDPADVAALFYSSNSVQAVPDGKGIQKCKGYIVAMKQAGGYKVYIAWHLVENGRVVVCLPDHQPSDSDECIEILKDAISYFEIVGFMMEVTDLGSTVKSYKKALRKIPVMKPKPAA